MRRFRFRLEKVQSVREVQERQAAASVAAARRAEGEVAAALDRHRADLAARRLDPGPRAGAGLLAEAGLLDLGHAQVRRTGDALVEAARLAADRTADWVQATRRVRALDLLEQRQRALHAVELARHEAALVDDLVAARAARHRGAGA